MELIILWIIGIYVISYRQNNGENVYRFFINQVRDTYYKFFDILNMLSKV